MILRILIILAALVLGASAAPAQTVGPPADPAALAQQPPEFRPDVLSAGELNPLSVLGGAAGALPQSAEGAPAGLSVAMNVVVLLTVISLAPSIMLMCTCFVRVIIVLGLLRQALGTQTMPPSQVILGLSLFITALVMAPTIERVRTEAIAPYQAGEIRTYDELWARARQPVRDFMFDQIEAAGNWSSLYTILNYRGIDTSRPDLLTRADVDTATLIPAFMLSELRVAFLLGFRVYLPFLVIDMVIASLLISMSMMMLPPVLISLPFKLLLFVMVDGWTLVVGGLLESFVVGPMPPPPGVGAAVAGAAGALSGGAGP